MRYNIDDLPGSAGGAGVLLDPYQRTALRLTSEGRRDDEIGKVLGLSAGAVRDGLARAAEVLGVGNRAQACRAAAAAGWI